MFHYITTILLFSAQTITRLTQMSTSAEQISVDRTSDQTAKQSVEDLFNSFAKTIDAIVACVERDVCSVACSFHGAFDPEATKAHVEEIFANLIANLPTLEELNATYLRLRDEGPKTPHVLTAFELDQRYIVCARIASNMHNKIRLIRRVIILHMLGVSYRSVYASNVNATTVHKACKRIKTHLPLLLMINNFADFVRAEFIVKGVSRIFGKTNSEDFALFTEFADRETVEKVDDADLREVKRAIAYLAQCI